jgi:hypothetical protein
MYMPRLTASAYHGTWDRRFGNSVALPASGSAPARLDKVEMHLVGHGKSRDHRDEHGLPGIAQDPVGHSAPRWSAYGPR